MSVHDKDYSMRRLALSRSELALCVQFCNNSQDNLATLLFDADQAA